MPTRPLLLGPDERQKIDELRQMAAANPMNVLSVDAAAKADIDAFRDMMRMQSIVLPVGYSVSYSHEIQPAAPPPGLCHHISISVMQPGFLPSQTAVGMILEAFGMKPLAQSESWWIETVTKDHKAINVLQLA